MVFFSYILCTYKLIAPSYENNLFYKFTYMIWIALQYNYINLVDIFSVQELIMNSHLSLSSSLFYVVILLIHFYEHLMQKLWTKEYKFQGIEYYFFVKLFSKRNLYDIS